MYRHHKPSLNVSFLLLALFMLLSLSACNKGSSSIDNRPPFGTGTGLDGEGNSEVKEPAFDLPTSPRRSPTPNEGSTGGSTSGYYQPGDLDRLKTSTTTSEFRRRSPESTACFREVSDGGLWEEEEARFHSSPNPSQSRRSHACFETDHFDSDGFGQDDDLESTFLRVAGFALDKMSYCFNMVLARRPLQGESQTNIRETFVGGGKALIRCYYRLKRQMHAVLPLRENVQRDEDNNNDLFYLLLLGGF